MPEFLEPAFMQRALLAAVIVGLCAPSVGIFLVQRRLALMGDGIGHIALTGVAVGLLTGTSPLYTAIGAAVIGAVTIELIRERGRTSGDVALAMLFYGGIAGGVVLVGMSDDSTTANLTAYLFGQLTSVSDEDILVVSVLGAVVLLVTVGLRRHFFAVCHDEEFARVSGLRVRLLNLLLAVLAAVTVTVALRVVGVLLISALMVVPVATAQQVARGFATTFALSMGLGVAYGLAGVVGSYYADTASGASIVVLAIAGFILTALVTSAVGAARGRRAGTMGLVDAPSPAPAHTSSSAEGNAPR